MGYSDIFYLKEEKFYLANQKLFKNFLDFFRRETGLDWQSLIAKTDIPVNDYRKLFYFLRQTIILNFPKYVPIFFKLLEDSGFDMSSEIIYAMKLIGKNTFDDLDEDLKQYILRSPIIDAVSSKKGKITIFSEEYGDYSFSSTKKYLYENKKALYLIQNYLTEGFCHQMSWEIMKYLNDASLITSLLPSYFEGEYYHTVIRDNNGLIIDSANEAVFDDDTRDFLFKGHDVVETKKIDLEYNLRQAIKDEDDKSKEIDFPPAMLLTLHQEFKNMNKR